MTLSWKMGGTVMFPWDGSLLHITVAVERELHLPPSLLTVPRESSERDMGRAMASTSGKQGPFLFTHLYLFPKLALGFSCSLN